MASQAEQTARKEWGDEKCAAFDRLMARFWERAAELAESKQGADLAIKPRISRGALVEVRLDRDEVEK